MVVTKWKFSSPCILTNKVVPSGCRIVIGWGYALIAQVAWVYPAHKTEAKSSLLRPLIVFSFFNVYKYNNYLILFSFPDRNNRLKAGDILTKKGAGGVLTPHLHLLLYNVLSYHTMPHYFLITTFLVLPLDLMMYTPLPEIWFTWVPSILKIDTLLSPAASMFQMPVASSLNQVKSVAP